MSTSADERGAKAGALLVGIGALGGLATVVLGALSAHALADRLDPAQLGAVRTALAYQGFHALALVMTGLLEYQAPSRWTRAAGVLFVLGTVLFCGSIYGKSLAGLSSLGPVTPLGGLTFMAGWICLTGGAWRRLTHRS